MIEKTIKEEEKINYSNTKPKIFMKEELEEELKKLKLISEKDEFFEEKCEVYGKIFKKL